MHVAYNEVKPFDFKGLQIRELTPKNLSSASIAEIEVAPEVGHPGARSTRSDKIYICLEGTVAFDVGSKKVILKPKDTLLVHKGEWFSYHNLEHRVARILMVHVPPFDLASEEFKKLALS